jgi:two-component system, LytTR family, response regulator
MAAAIHTFAPAPAASKLRTASLNTAQRIYIPINMTKKIALPTMEGISFENLHDIICLEAQGNYTMIYFIDGRQILVCKTLNMAEEMLTEGAFVRIHRSSTINLDRLKNYIKGKGGFVIMENNKELVVSEGKKQIFLDTLKDYFGLQ